MPESISAFPKTRRAGDPERFDLVKFTPGATDTDTKTISIRGIN
jgi:hypothetical protein